MKLSILFLFYIFQRMIREEWEEIERREKEAEERKKKAKLSKEVSPVLYLKGHVNDLP